MTKLKGLNFLCICCFLFLLSGKPSDDGGLSKPAIVAGTAKITGRIIKTNTTNKDSTVVTVIVLQPISGENAQYNVLVDQSGKFSIDVEVETDVSLVGLYTDLNVRKLLFVTLKSGSVTNLDIAYNSDNAIENIDITPAINQNDVTRGFEVADKMNQYKSNSPSQSLYDKSPDYFLNNVKTSISKRLAIVQNDTLLSEELKEVLTNDLRLWMYKINAFSYEQLMMLNYRNITRDTSKKPEIQKIDRPYYRFLKDLRLNDIQYLNCFTFQGFQKEVLRNEIIGLPEVGESDIPSWLKNAKAILSDLVGFDDGQYYDILVANAYGRQLSEELRSFSEKQKENIRSYFKDGEIAKILFRKNQKVVELDKFKTPVVVNDIPSVSDDKVMATIVSKYKDKVVLIDLWATWCAPCLEAMKEFRSTKNEFHDKDVVFVYLTNGSSPKKLWEEKIKGIGSEHYYLKNTQWDHMMDNFGFNGIPSYLLYNKEGVLINKFTGFPGNDKVKKMINDLL
ncbi:TlpA family protein disulfide reductase [Pedobacter frigoris]|uniref:TlpA family protein disulfide reductase n=1 Tax=Pedobacter frigoris TaxID=2571272 RepID=A0A4U1CK03_9SPHI|nr:TlpA disulfide reductase family protein [Pedobacter frigoris]TKC06946.1 TlpA family protein disulfide reductase [Pedobacter frigoris]